MTDIIPTANFVNGCNLSKLTLEGTLPSSSLISELESAAAANQWTEEELETIHFYTDGYKAKIE
jgi:hypothetical protein